MDLIETRIRQHYASEYGEWLVKKSKVKEAKLLKEACIELERLRKAHQESDRLYFKVLIDYNTKQNELEKREKLLAEREQKFTERLESFVAGLEYLK